MNGFQQLNRLMLLAAAPFLGLIGFLAFAPPSVTITPPATGPKAELQLASTVQRALDGLDRANQDAVSTRATIQKYYELYAASANEAARLSQLAADAATRPSAIFDSRFISRLGGKQLRSTSSDNIDLKLYSFSEARYAGHALKVTVKSDKGMRMTLGNDKVGGSETTQQAARRYGAIAGVNAGGFADDKRTGKRYPLSTTVYEGKYVYGFEPTFNDLTFIGLSKDRKLIGGMFSTQQQLDKLNPMFGATFVPVLLQGGQKQTIPTQWQTSPARAPRTVVGSLKNDQLVFLVTDGYDERGHSGATLAELQDKLLALGVKDAYNLDGGGSSSLIFDGQVINKPSDAGGRLRPMPTHFLFFK
ncbi:phosphodiester glycosidase family protein [Paenibacillus sp. YYML68]|uniref:phosphodiester glycosidase family protein n=1 Tax=Paenibacillus sp. YYML68 TaxID=2909250 RepID=UPI0024924E91|nr:phosphodiester glycosidase family protein [Paenibacillus sp. YYML68]